MKNRKTLISIIIALLIVIVIMIVMNFKGTILSKFRHNYEDCRYIMRGIEYDYRERLMRQPEWCRSWWEGLSPEERKSPDIIGKEPAMPAPTLAPDEGDQAPVAPESNLFEEGSRS